MFWVISTICSLFVYTESVLFGLQTTAKSNKFQSLMVKERQNYLFLHFNDLYQKNNSVPSVVWVLVLGFFFK